MFLEAPCKFRWNESSGRVFRECVSETSVKETWNPASFGWRGLLVSRPGALLRARFSKLQFDPHRTVVAGFFPAAHLAVHTGRNKALTQAGTEQ